jgi:hypothetical protein
VLAWLAPRDRADELTGDLLEDLEDRRRRDRAGGSAWLWWQVLASGPALLLMRGRRAARMWSTARARGRGEGDPIGPAVHVPPFAAFLGRKVAARQAPLFLSLALHGALLVFGVASSYWRVDEVAPPRVVIPPIFPMRQQPAAAPPRGGGEQGRKVVPRRPPTAKVVEPVTPRPDVPAPRETPPVKDLDDDHGEDEKEGVTTTGAGGAGGGVGTGGKGGGCSAPACGGHTGAGTGGMLAPAVAAQRCLHCPSPSLPPAYRHPGAEHNMLLRVCVDVLGEVTDVRALRGLSPGVDASVSAVVRGWRYSPFLLGGHAVPFCYALRFQFSTPR